MALRSEWRRAAWLGFSFLLVAGLATACGGGDTGGDDLIDDTASGGPRRPGGGPSSGGTFGSSSSSSSSGRSGSSSSSGESSSSSGGESSSSSSGGQSSTSSSSGAPACTDPDDAPDFEDSIVFEATTKNTMHTASGVIDGEYDVDWYGYDITGSPTTVVSLANAVPAELCVFYQCKAGTLTVQCNSGSVAAVDEVGNSGCCATGTATTAASLTTVMYCSPGADDSYTMISVTSLQEQCADYTAHFNF